jgi:H+/Cl- antiporter ClcA
MPQLKPQNPFFAVLIVVGIAFGLTACAYVVMTVRGSDPHTAGEGGLVGLMAQRGLTILVVELLLLGLLTVLAIGTDGYWSSETSGGREPPEA